MILVFSKRYSNRLSYTLDVVFRDVLQVDYQLTDSETYYTSYTGAKIAYTRFRVDKGIRIQPEELLFEQGVSLRFVPIGTFKDVPTIFASPYAAHLPFDVFAAVFYMVSRYEEYLPHVKDTHGRFPAKESLAYKNKFLQKAVVNRWIQELKEVILQHYPTTIFPRKRYTFQPTIDIDYAFAFKYRSKRERLKGVLGDFKRGQLSAFGKRMRVLKEKESDPYNTFNYLAELHGKHNLNPIYFFLMGYYGGYDRNNNPDNPVVQRLIRFLVNTAVLGIHPSYKSNENDELLSHEIKWLREIAQAPIILSRQHFLKLQLPFTYNLLIRNGIYADYSMAFADELGFRAGIATPYYFYNLLEEEKTQLVVFPTCVMDATLRFYQQCNPDEAIEKLQGIVEEVRAVKGTLVSIWHNNSVSDFGEWKGWRKVYERFLQEALP